LELYKEAAVAFDQLEALGELTVRWTGTQNGEIEVDAEFDDETHSDEPDSHDKDHDE
jgi:segregation and condensation protein A